MEPNLHPDHPALRELATPVLVVDGAALATNIAVMAKTAAEGGVALRPHAKTHKCVEIARLQLEAGACGIACATLNEAEALAAAGITGLLVTSPVVGVDKAARLARLNRHTPVAVVVDHPAQIDGLRAAAHPDDPPLGILIDLDVGQARTGVANVQDALALARLVHRERGFALLGLQGYAGHVQHILDPAERRAKAADAAERLSAAVAALMMDNLPCLIVSGSGTGAHRDDIGGPYSELQAGSYVFMDADYGRVRQDGGWPFTPALFVLATVVSVNQTGQVTVDAGTKALAVNGPPPAYLIGAPAGASYRFSGDEHGAIVCPPGAATPEIGARILIGATHCDPTVNLHAALHVVGADGKLAVWPVIGRYGAAV